MVALVLRKWLKNKMIKKYIFLILLSFYFTTIKAQDPNWSVNASNYQYSMTFTTSLNINGATLSSTEDKVAAFVNGELRGVANVVYVPKINKYVAYLSVFANTNGELINFKIFNSTNQNVVEITKTENFVIDGNVGGVFQSFNLASPTLSNEALLNSFSFSGITSVSQNISNNKIDIVLPSNTDITNLSAEFSISNGANFFIDNLKQVSGTSVNNFTNAITYKLLSENEAVLIEYEVNVSLEISNTAIPELVLQTEAKSFVSTPPVIVNLKTNVIISDFEKEAIFLINAVVSSINKIDDLNYQLQIIPIQQGIFSVEIPENRVRNNENKGNTASNKLSFTYDLVNPTIVSIKRKNPTDEITKNDSLEFNVIFSEDVENVFSSSFESVSNATISIVKETDSKYTVTVKNIENFIGIVQLNVKSSNTIKDKTGNQLTNSVFNAHQN